MRIIIQPGAHGPGHREFMRYLRGNRAVLEQAGVAVWTPDHLRRGVFAGLNARIGTAQDQRRLSRCHGRVRLHLAQAAARGQHTVLICDPSLLGSVRGNLDTHLLYPHLPDRLRALMPAFAGHSVAIGVEISGYDRYWTDLLAERLRHGGALPGPALLDHLTTQPRRWRSLLRKLAGALPGAALLVWSAERFAGQPAPLLQRLIGPLPAGLKPAADRLSDDLTMGELTHLLHLRGEHWPLPGDPTDRWRPFGGDRVRMLRAEYRDDLAWLRAGADDLATYIDGQKMPAPRPDRAEFVFTSVRRPLPPQRTGGHHHGIQERLG